MYVRCSIEYEHPTYPRRFAVGKITSLNLTFQEAKVSLYMHEDQDALYEVYQIARQSSFPVDKLEHVRILPFTKIKIKDGQEAEILSFSHESDNGIYNYFVQTAIAGKMVIKQVLESDLIIPFNRGDVDVLTLLNRYEFHQPIWYQHRQVVADSLHTLKNATFGFETLIGSRVFLMNHQVDTIVRAISEDPCRFMLADEVGLGKTIEAVVIMKGLQKRLGRIRILIIVPESLIYQWKNELSYKFWSDFAIYEDAFSLDEELLLFPLEKIDTKDGRQLLNEAWDLCIVDETHRLLRLENEYKLLYAFSQKVRHLLLLSATPIQDRQTEFLRLVALLEPRKYGNMTEDQFGTLLEKQDYLRVKVHKMMKDLPDYLSDDLAEDYQEDLEDISERLNDKVLSAIVAQIDIHAEDLGLSTVKLALAYIGEHYQIERKIMRHRRSELQTQLAKRRYELLDYEMRGSDIGYFEFEVYDAVLDYLAFLNEKEEKSDELSETNQLFLSAVLSSPWAVESYIKDRRHVLHQKNNGKSNEDSTETDLLQQIEYYNQRWQKVAELELKNIKELYDDPELINGRLAKTMDYLMSDTIDEQVVIFSEWKETLLPLEAALIAHYGADTVRSFYRGKSEIELQQAVDDFQNRKTCRFLLCDPLGGEGRNFQMADRIIHVDLPWSPSALEQRIGRLDRIGREKSVKSIVICSTLTIEEDLFHIWQEGLGIFEESLSGIEIAIGDIQRQIYEAIHQDIRSGLKHILPTMSRTLEQMRGRVEEERYFDMSRQLDTYVEAQLTRLIEKFDESGGKTLATTMMNWSSLTGLNGKITENGKVVVFSKDATSINSMKRTLYVLPNTKEALKRAKRTGEVRGTFDRELAINREGLVFYAPGDPFFDSIVNNAFETEWGRCCAMEVIADIDWEGIVYTWSTQVNPNPLLELNESLENLVHTQGYTPLGHFVTIESFQPGNEASLSDVLPFVSVNVPKHKIKHLGKRSNQSIQLFMDNYPLDVWQSLVQSTYERSRAKFLDHLHIHLDTERASNEYQQKLDALKAANLYYGNDINEETRIQRIERIYKALLRGIDEAELRLESAAYVRLVKRDAEIV